MEQMAAVAAAGKEENGGMATSLCHVPWHGIYKTECTAEIMFEFFNVPSLLFLP
jgi:hypothetical protein